MIPEFFPSQTFLNEYNDMKAKVITSIAMFYDLERPKEFVAAIKKSLHPEGVWLFEQSYLPFMLEKNSFDTICHEHLEYYSVRQIKHLLESQGLKIIDIDYNNVNGGSFAVLAAHKDSNYLEANDLLQKASAYEDKIGLDNQNIFIEFRGRINKQKNSLVQFLNTAKNSGKKVIGYGASTKGNVLMQYFGITSDLVPFIAEVNEDKFGAFTPGAKIPIISEQEAKIMKPDYFLVFPWHFKDFIINKEHVYLEQGGKLIFPLPEMVVV